MREGHVCLCLTRGSAWGYRLVFGFPWRWGNKYVEGRFKVRCPSTLYQYLIYRRQHQTLSRSPEIDYFSLLIHICSHTFTLPDSLAFKGALHFIQLVCNVDRMRWNHAWLYTYLFSSLCVSLWVDSICASPAPVCVCVCVCGCVCACFCVIQCC